MPVKMLREFIKYESSGGIVLFAAAVLALIVDNSPLHTYYQAFFHVPLSFRVGDFHLEKPLLLWINDGLMAIFFLLVGLEVKRECYEGELNSKEKAVLPGLAAIGGMVCPVIIFLALNHHVPGNLRGWAIPTATDIAFSLGILTLLGKRIPLSLKVFLTALAIFDDIGAIVVIAIFYTSKISLIMLIIAVLLVIVLFIMNRLNVKHYAAYFIVGFALWLCVLKSGVHATLAGIILACVIPIRDREQSHISPLRRLEHMLHPWVAFGVLPIFAFANAGVSFWGLSQDAFIGALPLGIALGLFLGKQIGVWGFSMLGIRMGIAKMPKGVSSFGLYGIALLAGVGFTMSLFIGGLAFGENAKEYAAMVRVGVIFGSLLSGLLGYFVLHKLHPKTQDLL